MCHEILTQICINIHPDAVPPIHSESYHVPTDKVPAKDGDKVITTKLAAAILGVSLFGGGVLPAQNCPCYAVVRLSYDIS